MKTKIRCVVLCLAVCVVLLSPRRGQAANQFTFDWYSHNHPNSCLVPGLLHEGGGYFHVNNFPIPTYTVAGSLNRGGLGEFREQYRAAFLGALFNIGTNDIEFSYTTDSACVFSDEAVWLRGQSFDRLLFQLSAINGNVSGATEIDITLREIDPNLADSLDRLNREIRDSDRQLTDLGQEVERVRVSESFKTKLDALINRGFDEISAAELDALLAQFDGLLPRSVRDALVAYLRDLQADVAALRTEITRISSVFDDRAKHIDGISDGAPGFNPQDPGGFTPIATGDPPPIDIPAVLGDEPWSDAHDPYAQYADQVLQTLQPTVQNGAVVQRATFIGIYSAWRYNTQVLENILQQRTTVTVREWGAFLNAKGRVLGFLEQYIDSDGWMRDAPVTPQLRAMVAFLMDLDAAYKFKQRAEALQLAINLWNRDALTEKQNALLNILVLFDEAVRARMAEPAPEEQEDGFWQTMAAIADGVVTAADIAVSFTPVGQVLDLCRALTGRSQCVTGEDLSTTERVMYGASSVISSAIVWKAAAVKLKGAAAGVVRTIGEATEQVVKKRPVTDFTVIEHLGGAKTYIHKSGIRVRYNRYGFPDFRPFKYKGTDGLAEVKITLTNNRAKDAAAANLAAGFAKTPPGYTWHHHEKLGRMILIETEVHKVFPHTGGFAINKVIGNI